MNISLPEKDMFASEFKTQLLGCPRIAGRLYYEITSRCNLQCMHCGNLLQGKRMSYLGPEQLLEFHKVCSSLYKVTDSVVTGGEPTLHKDFEQIVSGLSEHGSVVVTTNGTVLPPEQFADLLRHYPNVLLQISMDGISEQTFDYVRGSGAYQKVMRLLNCLANNNLNGQVGLSMTIMRHNIHEVQMIVDFARSKGMASLHFPALLPVGFARKNWDSIVPNVAQQVEVEEILLEAMVEDEQRPNISVNRISQVLTRSMVGIRGDCLANLTLKVDSEGNVLPCPATSNRSLSLGNISDANLPETLLDCLQDRWTAYLKLAGPELQECADCPAKQHCSARFCENCGVLAPPMADIADQACQVLRHHYGQALTETANE